MPIVIVASTNPVKIDATRLGFEAMFAGGMYHFQGVDVASGVSRQPMTDAETLTGARTRAENARTARPDADFWAGIEGGVEDRRMKDVPMGTVGTPPSEGRRMMDEGMHAFAWVVILGKELSGEARTGTFQLPPEITRLVRQGVELGHADDIVFQRSNSKQKDGAIGILTDGLIDRTAYYEHAVMLALVPFKKRELYAEE
jgi:inosine/xanthosine triphosphatase